jgi:hypothetical protein
MATLSTRADIVSNALKALGLQTERLKEVHIHIEPDDIVRADCVYYVTEPPLFSIEEFETIVKKYVLHFKEKTE